MASVQRLPRQDFSTWFRAGRKTSISELMVVVNHTASAHQHHFYAVVVPKTVSKKSTVRNKIKRQLRAILIAWLKQNLTESTTVIVVVRPAVQKLSFDQLKHKVLTILDSQ